MDLFLEYLLTNHEGDLMKILLSEDPFKSYSINVDFYKLFEDDPQLGDRILCNPNNVLPKCDATVVDAQRSVLKEITGTEGGKPSLKLNVRARFFGLPDCPELSRTIVPKNKDLNCFLRINGTAIRLTQAKMLEYQRGYKCAKCGYEQLVEGKYEQRYVIKAPFTCTSPDQCKSTTLVPIHNVSRDNCKDYQEMKIQEQINKLAVGGIPGSIWVTLEDDLVDFCKPGDDVSICGTVLRRWRPLIQNKKADVELVFKANHVQICNMQKSNIVAVDPNVKNDFNEFWEMYAKCPMKGREVILASVCPKIYGLYMAKLALLLTAITGCSHSLDTDGIALNKTISPSSNAPYHNVRGQCHLLLVGDPGTGKSQLLKAGAMLTSRSVLTSGSGSTKAGLTCTALREDGEWQLEAGALVLADGGVCCIDELAQMREHDRASIHEAMEQQTISVAKAGMICKLNTRCAVIAACNPKGNYDTEQPLSVNVSLGTPLLSRFDLIFILLDTKNKTWDSLVADYILFGENSNTISAEVWSLKKLQLYLSLIGPLDVNMTPSATSILQVYYVSQRKAEHRDPSRTTVRMLDSLVRLSQAHAKLMHRNKVLPVDAITAVCLMDLSMQDCTLTGTSNSLQTDFSQYPDFEYLKTAKRVLTNLNLCDIWQQELLFYARLVKADMKQLDNDIDNDDPRIFSKIEIPGGCEFEKSTDDVIESTYFKEDKINKDKTENMKECRQEEKTRLFTNVVENSDDDIDEILDFNVNFNDKNKNKENIVIQPSTSKATTSELLAKTLKKQSLINKNSKLDHIGIISEKCKRPKKPTRVKNKDVKVSKRKRSNVKDTNQKKKIKISKKKSCISMKNSIDEFASSSEEELNEGQMLNCLPSVNDVFNGLKIDFTISDEDASITSSPKELLHDDSSHKTIHSSINESKSDSLEEESFTKNVFDENISKKKSFKSKLEQFAYVERKKDDPNKSVHNSSHKTSDSEENVNKSVSDDKSSNAKSNNLDSFIDSECIMENSHPAIRFTSTQKSMFDNDDLDCLDL